MQGSDVAYEWYIDSGHLIYLNPTNFSENCKSNTDYSEFIWYFQSILAIQFQQTSGFGVLSRALGMRMSMALGGEVPGFVRA